MALSVYTGGMSRLRTVLFLLICGFIGLPHLVFAEERILDLDVQATLDAQRHFVVTEQIQYDFDENERHGIFRTLPITYRNGERTYALPITFLSATVDGVDVSAKVTKEDGKLTIRLGDPDVTITGAHTYVIRYATDDAVTDWSDHQELYWNVHGTGWGVPAEKASFTLRGPGMVQQAVCYTGFAGDASHDCQVVISATTTHVEVTRALQAGEGMTVAVSFPLGTISAVPFWRVVWNWLFDHPIITIPFITFVCMFLLWWTRGRDPIGRGTIIPGYEEPRGLSPALLGTMVHEGADSLEVTATILDLARRGYILLVHEKGKAEGEEGEWQLKRTDKEVSEKDLLPFEKKLLTELVPKGRTITIQTDPGTYTQIFKEVRTLIVKETLDRGFFVSDPMTTRGRWIILSFILVFVSMFFASTLGITFFLALLLSGIIIGFFGWYMPRTTPEGARLVEEIEGFKHFLTVTEQERLAFHDAPAKKPEQFSRFLAVAVVLGVEKQWAKQFEGMMLPAPSYIQGSSTTWSAVTLAHSVDMMRSNLSLGMAPVSSSGSGGSGFSSSGSSGGGGGGGGGGSW